MNSITLLSFEVDVGAGKNKSPEENDDSVADCSNPDRFYMQGDTH